jgi:hypothetical protein
MRRFRVVRAVVLAAVTLALAAAVAPLVHADRFRGQIVRALQEALDRKVEIAGSVRFQILPFPGFSARNVVIHDDPSMGLEPLAYVDSLDVGVRLASLWRWRLEVAALRLVEPSVNLVKNRQGEWNYPPLLDRAFGASRHRRPALPEIQVRAGRLNFKFGDTKSVFYFSDADLDVSPAAETSAVRVRFAGALARTDRRLSGVGLLSGRGSLLLAGQRDSRVDLNLHLDRSAISEILLLLQGRSVGVGGFVTSTARLEGPLSAIQVAGRIQLVGIPRGFLPLPADRGSLEYTGGLDLDSQELHLESRPGGQAALPVWIRFRLTDYLRAPRWALGLTFRRLPVDSLPALAREMGFNFPPGSTLQGFASGAVSWSAARGIRGQVALEDAEAGWKEPAEERLRIPQARLLFDADTLRFTAPEVGLDQQALAVEALYWPAKGKLDARLATEELAIDRFLSLWPRLIGADPPPVLRSCAGGAWAGSLRYAEEEEAGGAWSGIFSLREATIELEGLAHPLRVGSAAVRLGRTSRIRFAAAQAGGIPFTGEYSFDPDAPRPHRFELRAELVDAARLERLLEPALRRGRRGLLARTLRLPLPPLPSWLAARRAEGSLEISKLQAGALRLEALRARLYWDGAHVEAPRFEAKLGEAGLSGRLAADLAGPAPRYSAQLHLGQLDWDGGVVSADFRLETNGSGAALLQHLRADGSFAGRSLTLAGRVWDRASGCFQLRIERAAPQVRLCSVELAAGARTYYGFGLADSGAGELDLFHNGDQLRLSGPFFFRAPPESGGTQQQSR